MQTATNISKRTNTFLSTEPVMRALLLAAGASLLVQYTSQGNTYNVASIYSGVFGLLAIFAGFLTTFFVFVATKSNAFLEAIKSTITFKKMVGLLRVTIIWTLFAVLATFILMVIEPKDFEILSFFQAIVFLWAWFVILIGVNFSRCVVMFLSLVEQE